MIVNFSPEPQVLELVINQSNLNCFSFKVLFPGFPIFFINTVGVSQEPNVGNYYTEIDYDTVMLIHATLIIFSMLAIV